MGSAGFEPATHRKRKITPPFVRFARLTVCERTVIPARPRTHKSIEKKKKLLVLEEYFTT